jgi:hypothetical protein
VKLFSEQSGNGKIKEFMNPQTKENYEARIHLLADTIDDAANLWLRANAKNLIMRTADPKELTTILKAVCKKSACEHLTPEEVIDAFCEFTVQSFIEVQTTRAMMDVMGRDL